MGHQDDGLGAVIEGVFDCWDGTDDTLIVGDSGPIERDIEVDSTEDTFACN